MKKTDAIRGTAYSFSIKRDASRSGDFGVSWGIVTRGELFGRWNAR
jgi:hypothetical protein